MKFITREVTYYKYTFGTYDVDTQTFHDIHDVLLTDNVGSRKMAELMQEHGVLLKQEEVSKMLYMSKTDFIEAAERWMEEHPEDVPSQIKKINQEDVTNG